MPYHSRILIVDDQPTIVAILRRLLGGHYELQSASSGEEVLAVAEEFSPALILLDIMMPGIDGYTTCRRLRAHPTLRHSKIIMLSAAASVAERLQGYEAGADDYLTKPFDEEELLAKVRVYLRLKSVEEVDRLTSDLLALLSHEVRTPLHGIMSPIHMLVATRDMDSADRTALLDLVQHNAQQLLRLFARISKLSQLKSGQWDFTWTTADLCDLVRDTVSDLAADAARGGIDVEMTLADAAPVRLDRLQMGEVLSAVFENAIRYSPISGQVKVAVECHRGRICLRVRDQGPGLDADFLPYVFEPLAQPDSRHSAAGPGLSLAIAQQIVLAHQGTIRLDSIPGAGTIVTVWLPAARGATRGRGTPVIM